MTRSSIANSPSPSGYQMARILCTVVASYYTTICHVISYIHSSDNCLSLFSGGSYTAQFSQLSIIEFKGPTNSLLTYTNSISIVHSPNNLLQLAAPCTLDLNLPYVFGIAFTSPGTLPLGETYSLTWTGKASTIHSVLPPFASTFVQHTPHPFLHKTHPPKRTNG